MSVGIAIYSGADFFLLSRPVAQKGRICRPQLIWTSLLILLSEYWGFSLLVHFYNTVYILWQLKNVMSKKKNETKSKFLVEEIRLGCGTNDTWWSIAYLLINNKMLRTLHDTVMTKAINIFSFDFSHFCTYKKVCILNWNC